MKNYDIKEILTMVAALAGLGIADINTILSGIGIADMDQGDFVRTYKECDESLRNLRNGVITLGEFQEDMRIIIERPRQLTFLGKTH